MKKSYAVSIDFSIDGVVGRHTTQLECEAHVSPTIIVAWSEIEDELIENGYQTFDCGCCLNDKRVKYIRHEVIGI